MRVTVTARYGTSQASGLELKRHYTVHHGPDVDGTVLVLDDNTQSFRPLTPAEYREVPDPLEPHDLLRIDHTPNGYRAVCLCVWRHWRPVAHPDEAAHTHQRHLRHIDIDRRHLTMPIHPLLQQWINDLRDLQRRQEPER